MHEKNETNNFKIFLSKKGLRRQRKREREEEKNRKRKRKEV